MATLASQTSLLAANIFVGDVTWIEKYNFDDHQDLKTEVGSLLFENEGSVAAKILDDPENGNQALHQFPRHILLFLCYY